MLKKILIVVVVIIVVFLVIVALQPADFHVARSVAIAAPPEAVFRQVNEPKKWEACSPWMKIDPAMKQTYEGPAAGNGAVMSWTGNKQAAARRMTLTESRANELRRGKR